MLATTALSELATRRPAKDAGPARLRAAGEADAAVRNADAMAAMGLLPGFLKRWERLNEQAIAPQMRAGQRSAVLSALAKAARLFGQAVAASDAGGAVVAGTPEEAQFNRAMNGAFEAAGNAQYDLQTALEKAAAIETELEV